MAETSNIFDELINSQLSSVEFAQDYLQLRFDGPTINVNNPITVKANQKVLTSRKEGFRDLLCSQIGKIVNHVFIESDKEFIIDFSDKSQIAISLLPKDYTCPEAIYAHGFKDNQWITY